MTTTDPKLIERIAEAMNSRSEWLLPEEVNGLATAILPIIEAAINEAAQKERAGVVAWLRGQAAIFNDQNPNLSALPEWTLAQKWANAIERSEHLPSPPAIEAKESQHG